MNVFELFAVLKLESSAYKAGLSEAESQGSKMASNIGSALAKGTAALATGITALTKIAVSSYSEYEQLVGGAELLFGDAYNFISEKAANAYKTVQLSQSDYLEQVNGFATGLKTALGGDAQAAAELADRIVTAEADVVAATGASQEAVQNAFNGIMKSNYTMVDNLQLGITPTKEGFQEMIDSVNKWNKAQGKATSYTIDNLADCQNALVDYIEMQGLAGYATNEASDTIAGSVSTMKAAWENFITGLGSSESDMLELTTNLVDSAENVLDNIVPVVDNVITNIVKTLPNVINTVLPKLMDNVTKLLPTLTKSITSILKTVVSVLPDFISDVVSELPTLIIDALEDLLPAIGEAIGKLILKLPSMLGNVVTGLVNGFKDIFGKKYKAEDIFSETVLGNVSAFQDYCSDFTRECNKAIANISGNVSWAEALTALDQADALVDAVKETWKNFNENYQSTEDVTFSVNATVTDVMTKVSTLLSIMGSDGTTYTGENALAKSLVNEINNLVGEDVLTYDDVPAVNAIVDEINTMIEDGITKESVISEIEADINELLGLSGEEGGIPLEPIPVSTEAVITQASIDWISQSGVNEGETWEQFLIRKLKEAGYPETVTDSVAAAISMNAEVETAFTSSNANGTTYATIQAVLEEAMKNGTTYDSATGQYKIDAKAVAEVIFQMNSEGKTPEEIADYLDTNFPKSDGTPWSAEIVAEVRGLEDAEALNSEIEKLIKNQILQANTQLIADTNSEQRGQYQTAEKEYEAAWEGYNNATDGKEKATYYQAASDALSVMEALQGEGDAMFEDYAVQCYNMNQDLENMVTTYEDIPESAKTAYEAMRQSFTYGSNDLKEFQDDLSNVNPEDWSHSWQLFDGTNAIASQAYERIKDSTNEVISGIKDGSIEAEEGIQTILDKEGGLRSIAENLQLTKEDIEATAEATGIAFEDLYDWLQEDISNGKMSWSDFFTQDDQLEKVKNILIQRYTESMSAYQESLEGINNDIEVDTTGMETAGEESANAYIDSFESADFHGTGSSAASDVKSGFSSYNRTWSLLGQNVALGLTSGLNEQKPYAVTAMETLAKEMEDKLKEVWGIASPSKVAKQMMGYIADGFVESAEDNTSRVSNALSDMVSADVEADIGLSVANNADRTGDLITAMTGLSIYLDGNTLVGHTISRVDKALQNNRNKSARGNVVFA